MDSRLFSGLPVLAAVLDSGSFVRAGETLRLTQSGVSRAIQRLEERLGIRLFERNPRKVELTEEGRRFCEEALPILGKLEEAAEETANASGKVRGRLRINVDPTFARLHLARRVGEFLATYPELQMELAIRDRLGDLVAEGFDAAVRFGDPQPSSLIVRRLLQARIYTCASPAYLERRGRPKTPHELESKSHECLLFRDWTTGRPFTWEFHQGRKRLTVPVSGRLVVDDALTHLEACLAGLGVDQVMDLGSESLIRTGQLVNVFPDWSDELFPLYLYHPSRHFMPAKLTALTKFLASSLEGAHSAVLQK